MSEHRHERSQSGSDAQSSPTQSCVRDVMEQADKMSEFAVPESLEETVRRLQAENLQLRERLSHFEMISAVSQQSIANYEHMKSMDFDELLSLHVGGLTPHTFKKDFEHLDEVQTYPERPHFDRAAKHPATELVVFDGCPNDPYHPSSMPLYQTATFVQPNIENFGPYDYSRSGNPTRTALETLVGKLEGAHAAFAFSTGMAALSSLLSLLQHGDEVIAGADLYGGMHRLLMYLQQRSGAVVHFIDTRDLSSVEQLLRTGKVKLVHIESPSNPLMRITDIRALCELCHRPEYGALVSADATMMSPVRCHPLALGCDAVIHSGTKFFSGHSDTMSGFIAVRDPAVAKRIAFVQNAEGTALAPFDSWLMLRGLKTLSLRFERQEVNAIAVALFLTTQTQFVVRLHYAGISPEGQHGSLISLSPAEYRLHHSQCGGPGSVMSFETGSVELSRAFVDACKIFKLTVSFGSCNSLVEMPCALSHASIPKHQRTLPEDLVRLSVGIENVHDLIEDLNHAIFTALRKTAEAANPNEVGCNSAAKV